MIGGIADSDVVLSTYGVFYIASPPAALLALILGLALRGRVARLWATIAMAATFVILGNAIVMYLTDSGERDWEPWWFTLLALAWGIASLALLGWSLRYPPRRASDETVADRPRGLAVMGAGLVSAAAYTWAIPVLWMFFVSPG